MKYLLAFTIGAAVVLGLSPIWAFAQFFSGSQYWAALLLYLAVMSGLNVRAKG